jgi:hypothetical protein
MRKLAWFIIFLAILTPSLVALGLAVPAAGDAMHYFFVDLLGIGTMNVLVGAATAFLYWGSINGLQAAAVILSLWIFGGIVWVLVKKYLWDIPHTVKQAISKTPISTAVREEPRDIVMAESPASTKTAATPQQPKEEVVTAEPAS